MSNVDDEGYYLLWSGGSPVAGKWKELADVTLTAPSPTLTATWTGNYTLLQVYLLIPGWSDPIGDTDA
jgi:hypothetical protein